MITVMLFKNKQNQFVGFTMEGHAGYAEEGADIVCAAATTAAMTAVNGLTDVVGISMQPEVSSGCINCMLPVELSDNQAHDAFVILKSMELTFINLTELYGDYITMKVQKR